MFSRVRKHFNPASIVALIALIFAMTGGAFAIGTRGRGAGHTNELASVAKRKPKPTAKTGPRGPVGPAGKAGAPGPQGPQGPQGPASAKGEAGAKGDTGARGEAGPEGPEGPEGSNGEAGPSGPQGVTGAKGEKGEPWAPENVLPAGATETGAWGARPSEGEHVISTISFPVALTGELDEAHVHIVPSEPEAAGAGDLKSGGRAVTGVTTSSGEFKVGAGIEDTTDPANIPPGTRIVQVGPEPNEIQMSNNATADATGDSLKAGNPAGCPAGASARKPAAEGGNLCVYVGENVAGDAKVTGPYKPYEVLKEGAGAAGALIDIAGGPSINLVWGTWAVKAP